MSFLLSKKLKAVILLRVAATRLLRTTKDLKTKTHERRKVSLAPVSGELVSEIESLGHKRSCSGIDLTLGTALRYRAITGFVSA